MEKLYSTKLNENNQIREKYLLDVSYDKSSKALQNKFWLDYKDFTYKGNILKVNFIGKNKWNKRWWYDKFYTRDLKQNKVTSKTYTRTQKN